MGRHPEALHHCWGHGVVHRGAGVVPRGRDSGRKRGALPPKSACNGLVVRHRPFALGSQRTGREGVPRASAMKTILIVVVLVLILLLMKLSGVAFLLTGWVLKLLIVVGGLLALLHYASRKR